jgi:polyisoprenyl-phosphate glycosyltransferase
MLFTPAADRVVVLLPIHNEEANLDIVVNEIDAAFLQVGYRIPMLLLVDDGSHDRSLRVADALVQERGNVCCLSFSRNFGHQAAVMAGLAYAPADCIVLVMDADGQDPAEIGVALVDRVVRGVDMAYGVRRNRQGRNPFKKFAYWSFYRILAVLAPMEIPLDAGDFCAYSPRAVQMLSQLKEQRPYVRGLRAWVGLRQVGLPYDRPDRYAGDTSYSLKRLFQLAADGIVSFSLKPLRLALMMGLLTFLVCLGLGFVYLMFYLLDWHVAGLSIRQVPGFTTLTLLLLGFSGLQMMMLGIIGEYLGRVFEESKGRPLFVVAATLGSLDRNNLHILPERRTQPQERGRIDDHYSLN